jgi:hypothetical protein
LNYIAEEIGYKGIQLMIIGMVATFVGFLFGKITRYS